MKGIRVDTRTHPALLTIYVSSEWAPWIRQWNPHATVIETPTPSSPQLRGL